jgi:Legionella pneumophila major outer membrane protein precursor
MSIPLLFPIMAASGDDNQLDGAALQDKEIMQVTLVDEVPLQDKEVAQVIFGDQACQPLQNSQQRPRLQQNAAGPYYPPDLMCKIHGLENHLYTLERAFCQLNDQMRYETGANCQSDLMCKIDGLEDKLSTLECAICQLNDQFRCYDSALAELACPPDVCEECYCWSAALQVLYWTIQENFLDYVVSGGPPTEPGLAVTIGQIGNIKNAEFNWRPGFRVTLERMLPNCAELEFEYTYFHTEGSDSESPPSPNLINGTFHQITLTTLGLATSDISFNYNIAHIMLAQKIFSGNNFALRAQAGILGGSIRQKWNITYLSSIASSYIDIDWHFYGAGLKGGFNYEWYFCHNLGLLSKLNLGLVYGAYHNKIVETIVGDTRVAGVVYNPVDASNSDRRFTQTLQLSLGPIWTKYLARCSYSIFAFYEVNSWFNIQETYRSNFASAPSGKDSDYTPGLIMLHGLTAGLEFNF